MDENKVIRDKNSVLVTMKVLLIRKNHLLLTLFSITLTMI